MVRQQTPDRKTLVPLPESDISDIFPRTRGREPLPADAPADHPPVSDRTE